ncbi:hypothetical protein PR002_g30883 [Phytophthora rubi]|uniref:Uncharacterized protein n=1 Tax=Phytophthora rubi TaxID=129364 RepID=A0A6A3GRX1_9STRA|nr:hypothetical protein PR002_g30883 [Phytophthora rubi]
MLNSHQLFHQAPVQIFEGRRGRNSPTLRLGGQEQGQHGHRFLHLASIAQSGCQRSQIQLRLERRGSRGVAARGE